VANQKKQKKPADLSAEVMHPDGRTERVWPAGLRWKLAELQKLVGGFIELANIPPEHGVERCAILNEDGFSLSLPLNPGASLLLGKHIVGPVVIIQSALLD